VTSDEPSTATAPRPTGPSASALELTEHQARLVHLAAQGLLAPPSRRASKPDVARAIVRMEVLQIDTIAVVARSPYLVLFSRLGPYPVRWLDELLADGHVFECWSHEASFAPIADYALHRRHIAEVSHHWAVRRARRVERENGKSLAQLLEHVRQNGPVKASHFARTDGSKGGWWGWKAEKVWLEALFVLGDLMISRRENFQRVYDLTERVLARAFAGRPDAWSGTSMTPLEVRRRFVLKAARALGVAQARWLADYFRLGKRVDDAELDALVATGDLTRVRVAGWGAPGYVHRANLDLAQSAAAGRLRATHTALLSPFDPVVWDRSRASALFGFDYRIECYTPAAKRTFGYFVLPILRRGRLVGRLDAKAHRGDRVFEVKAIALEPAVAAGEPLVLDVARALQACADWHDAPRVKLPLGRRGDLAAKLRAALRGA
jgi:uncharacterized protein